MKCRLQFQDVTRVMPNILILCSSHFILRLFTIPWAPVVALVIREYINKIQILKMPRSKDMRVLLLMLSTYHTVIVPSLTHLVYKDPNVTCT